MRPNGRNMVRSSVPRQSNHRTARPSNSTLRSHYPQGMGWWTQRNPSTDRNSIPHSGPAKSIFGCFGSLHTPHQYDRHQRCQRCTQTRSRNWHACSMKHARQVSRRDGWRRTTAPSDSRRQGLVHRASCWRHSCSGRTPDQSNTVRSVHAVNMLPYPRPSGETWVRTAHQEQLLRSHPNGWSSRSSRPVATACQKPARAPTSLHRMISIGNGWPGSYRTSSPGNTPSSGQGCRTR